MPVKPPTGSGTPVKVNPSTRPNRPVEVEISLPGSSGRRGSGSGNFPDPLPRAPSPSAMDPDATPAAPAVLVRAGPVEIRPSSPELSLESYLLDPGVTVPTGPDSEGLRIFDNRTYVDVAGGRIAPVGLDPDSGLHRARKLNRLLLGPVMLRETESGLWYVREVVEPTTRAQVKKYFPEATDQHADDFIARFGDRDAAEVKLKGLQLGLVQMHQEISAWEATYKGSDDHERNRRLAIGEKFRRLYKWQGDENEKVYRDGRLLGFELELNLGTRANLNLPIFSKRLDSVVSLSLKGSVVRNLGDFLSTFSHVETLKLKEFGIRGKELLDAIAMVSELRTLSIQHTNLRPLPPAELQFKVLPRLQELDLGDCTIQSALSVSGMTELRVLKVSNSYLLHLPEGLNDLALRSRLRVLDLHGDRYLQGDVMLSGMSELRVLDLSGTNLSPEFGGFDSQAGPLPLEVLRLASIPLRDAPSLMAMPALRELDLSHTLIKQLPVGLVAEGGLSRLEVLKLNGNPLTSVPTLEGMTALREIDLSYTGIDRFPEGVTREIPKENLRLSNNLIKSIPDTIELRLGFELINNPISDPASLRRLMTARRQTGADIWLGRELPNYPLRIDHWMKDVPAEQFQEKHDLWEWFKQDPQHSKITSSMAKLTRTPEYQIEHSSLQLRVWILLNNYKKADPVVQELARTIGIFESSPAKMLNRMEDEIRKHREGGDPAAALPKRPRLTPG
ncbi:leucine-rich repeat domain-containing protein [Pseudomonas sp. P155]|uniref:RING-type E3 ubiquitin transferase n=1 Tax=Pseudomonas neuropathica TaxID=2730425 RepID=A0ABS0BLS0_9PSED|nr:leucine-rich repeat domain-containing protein [Pseudomonas neuropathica]MBF6035404.1 leucine-rich repeat domain-containing protein [Pseudomonas neuropathica]